ncbi:hypothetical protein PF011_g26101 [Phytophthora fragariae]|uniref:Uncharacterized protein n=1 Tax=Phytophthora fragariae TaxID=53985 RepID=A0A6A3HPH5_9STRA|nr:hypothetical protein PF011_g26101 [Phytophthora fragariae]
MADRLIHQRVFKVSKELNRLDMLCNQHRRQTGHHDGLPDWEQPRTPAGKASTRHQRTPAFFAWDEASWQTQTPQKVVRRLDMTPAREREAAEPVPERSPFGSSSEDGRVLSLHVEDEGMDEDSAIEVDSEGEEEQPIDGVRTVAVSPAKEDILDRGASSPAAAAAVQMRASNPSLSVDASSSPYRSSSNPRYRHGRRLLESDATVPSLRSRGNAAGVTTEQADRYRMSRSSGKRFRSPAKPTSLWGDLCNSYIHQSSGNSTSSSRNASSFSHKRLARTAAERTFGGSSVFPTLNTDTYNWPPGERQSVLTGSDARNVANQAVREFLGGRDEETKQSELPVPPRQRSVDKGRLVPATEAGEDALSTGSNKKSKRVSFGSKIMYQQPRTLPVLADKTTQTDDSLLTTRSARKQRSDQANEAGRYPACDATVGDSERPRKVPRGPENSSVPAPQRNYRRASSSSSQHLTNPILLNPRYPPEPATFRGRSAYSSAFNDRLAWR